MADLSAVKLPNNTTYNLKDSKLRDIVGEPTAPYTEVEWVESNGTQYVYLDWKPPIATWGFEADFIIKNTFNTTQAAWRSDTNASNAGALFGTRNASGVNCVECNSYSANGYLRIGGSGSVATSATFKKDKTRQTVKLIGTTLTHSNGTTSTVTRVSETANKPYANMTVFCFHDGIRRSGTGNLAYPSTSRIYSLKFYDGTTLKVDLVGAIRNKDGVTGLYDKIKKHFYPAHGMTYGSVVGDLGESDTITSTITKSHIIVYADNRTDTRLIRATVPELDRLDDGQQITLIYSTAMSNSTQTTELAGWDDTSSNANVYLKLTLADNSTTEWIPCYYSNTGRLAGHYGGGTPIFLTYRENALLNATTTSAGTAVMRGWWHDPDYNTDDVYTRYSDTLLAGLNGVKRYSLNMRDANGNWTSIMNEDNNANATGKTAYSGGLMFGGILYHNSGSNIAAGGNTAQMCESRGGIDFRYSVNGVTSTAATTELQLRKPVYLVGTAGSDGLFYLDQTKWWTQTSFETGKVYVLVGTAYSSYYAIFVSVNNPVYTWDGTKLVEFDDQRIRTAESKLAGIASGAEVNQNAFSNVKVGSTTVSADTKTDTLEFAGSNVTLTPDATNDKVTIGISASNVTTALGNTAVARATGDASGNAIASTYVKKSGDTMTGLLNAPSVQTGKTITNVANYIYRANAKETIIYTGIKYVSSAHMPVVRLKGYAYGSGRTIELCIALYIYQNEFYSSRTVTNLGVWTPEVFLYTYTKNDIDYVAIGLKGAVYFNMFSVDVQDEMGSFFNIDKTGWTVEAYADNGTIPDLGTNHCVSVSYGIDILNPPKVNGHTVNKDVPSNAVFTDTTALGSMTGTLGADHGGTGQTSLINSANALINALSTGSSTPSDNDYYVSQYVNGGTTTTTFHRRPMSALWAYIQGKFTAWAKNLTAAGNLGWTSQDAGKIPITVNGVAYWNGRYNATNSNLEYCKKGAFGTAAIADLSTATNSVSTTTAATSSAVKTAYDLANQANGTANTALSGVNGTLIYDHTYTIANGVATFTAHVYCKGVEVTNEYADADFSWSYRIDNTISGTGTPSVVSLGTGKTKTVNISVLGLGGHVIGTFTTT